MTPSFVHDGRYWMCLLATATFLLVGLEMTLLAESTGYFSGGYQAGAAAGPASIAMYAIGAMVLDAVLVVGSWLILFPILSKYRGGPFRCATIALLIGVLPAAVAALARHQVHVVLGRFVTTSLVGSGADTASGSASALAAIDAFAPPTHVSILVAIAMLGMTLPLAGRALDHRWELPWVARPDRKRLLRVTSVGVVVAIGLIVFSLRNDPPLHDALKRKLSGLLVAFTVDRLTDFDLDGYGLLARPRDPAIFDGSVYPYAFDVPGNRIDENGIGGDHPAGALPPVSAAPPRPKPSVGRPHVLFIFLETFRVELLESEVDGRRVTPFLASLARAGGSSERMFVHSPWTLSSRDALFLGSLGGDPENGTLREDFANRGYVTAHFSGQDDSYGDSASRLGFDRADHFYDARNDIERRTSRSTAAVGLQVSWKTVLERVDAYLDDYASDRPLFLYVNIVDTHFPFTHHEIDEIVASPKLDRSEIRAHHADRIYRTYENTAANVDRAVEHLVKRWRSKFEGHDQALVITADHGESFYEAGTLGHGHTVQSIETRVPLIVHGIGGEWPEPIAISDLRGLVTTHVGVEMGDVRPKYRVDPNRFVFQYLGPLEAPARIALRRWDGADVFDVLESKAWHLDAREVRVDTPLPRPAVDEIVWTWEDLQLQP